MVPVRLIHPRSHFHGTVRVWRTFIRVVEKQIMSPSFLKLYLVLLLIQLQTYAIHCFQLTSLQMLDASKESKYCTKLNTSGDFVRVPKAAICFQSVTKVLLYVDH